jgi:site-specific recombinase XerD
MSGTRRKAGQLGPQVEGYQAWLTRRGYTPGTVRHMLKDLGQVGLWLSTEGLGAAQLDEQRMAAFLTARQVKGEFRRSSQRWAYRGQTVDVAWLLPV